MDFVMTGRFGSLVRWMLAALLLVGSLPVRQHSHAGGDQAHAHRSPDGHFTRHCDDLCVGGQTALAASHAHLHFAVFGLNVTLPMPADSEDHDESGANSCFVVGPPPAITPAGSGPETLVLASDSLTAFGAAARLPMLSLFTCIPAGAAPLCDTARHERSGVQLI